MTNLEIVSVGTNSNIMQIQLKKVTGLDGDNDQVDHMSELNKMMIYFVS